MSVDESPRATLHRLVHQARLMIQAERDAGVADAHGTPAPQLAPPPAPRPAPRRADPVSVRPRAHSDAPTRPPQSSSSAPPPRSPAAAVAASRAPATAPRPAARPARTRPFVPKVRALDLPADALAPFGDLPARVAACTRCGLCDQRTNTVFGEGVANARLVFCGDGPGFEEDRSGRPFVGRAGELLTRMIEGGMKLRREDVFVLNAVKCRPPDNRAPTPEEIGACSPYLEEQLKVIAPQVIVTLGDAGTRAVLGAVGGIAKVRGQVFEKHGAQVVPTFHPADLLRNPAGKREAWEDLKLVLRLLNSSESNS